MTSTNHREFLLDVSRLIWRVWSGRLPTGIDRVCLEYAEHFGSRSLAVARFRGRSFVFTGDDSDRLLAMLRQGFGRNGRRSLIRLGPGLWLRARRSVPRKRMFYLNVGHTGLDQPGLSEWIARNGLRAVYLIHDLIPLTHPEFCRPGEGEKHACRMSNALASASGIIGNSQATLSELATFASARGLPMPPSVVALISGHRLAALSPKSLDRPYFVVVGTIEGRKNHLLLLRVWQQLVAEMGPKAPILLVIGQRGWEAAEAHEMLDRNEFGGNVRELPSADDQELAAWIAGARALLMPSFAEGFGLPVVEALELGTPVIATDLPVYREIAADIPAYLEAHDLAGWKNTISNFATSSAERERQVAAMDVYRAPSWPDHFRIVEDWLRTL